MIELAAYVLFYVACAAAGGALAWVRFQHRNRYQRTLRNIDRLELELGLDDATVEHKHRMLERKRLEATKGRYRKTVRAAVGDVFDAHFAEQRRRRPVFLPMAMSSSAAVAWSSTPWNYVRSPYQLNAMGLIGSGAAAQHKAAVDGFDGRPRSDWVDVA